MKTSDTLWLAQGKLQCESEETEYDIDTTVVNILAFTTVMLGQIASPAGLFILEQFLVLTESDDLPDRGARAARWPEPSPPTS